MEASLEVKNKAVWEFYDNIWRPVYSVEQQY